MVLREEILKKQPDFNFKVIGPLERIVFFDIETTGLARKSSCIYLIGMVLYEDGLWKLKQYFANSHGEERLLLEKFADTIRSKNKNGRVILISFNGDSFDIPFIKEAMRSYDLYTDAIFARIISLDLLKVTRPLKYLLGLSNCKLKTVEKLFGLDREDKFSGGELIYVYEEFLKLSNILPGSPEDNESNHKLKESLLETLLLHNAEDIMDMPFILGILGYNALKEGNFEILGNEIVEYNGANGLQKVWDIKAELEIPVPKGLYFEQNGIVLSVGEEDPAAFNLTVSVYEGELKYFYADYKNYYYLPAEDYAVHKSVGQYVDSKLRRQATKATCYQKKKGLFIPQAEAILSPVFYKDEKKTERFGEVGEIFSGDDKKADNIVTKRYILSVVGQMMK